MESKVESLGSAGTQPLVSIIILNYNGVEWLRACFASIRSQTIVEAIETIFVDNNSTDSSVATAKELLANFPGARVIANPENPGFSEGNNIGARVARGRYLFFLNPDTRLELDCMEKLLAETEKANADAATPWVLQYASDEHQDVGFFGFDILGLPSPSSSVRETREVFAASGCAFLIHAELFKRIGSFDREFFMYCEDADLSWRLWIAGGRMIGVPAARMHHRGAAGANPFGGAKVVEFRTTDQKRFLTNRNSILTLLKNGQHLVALFIVPLSLFLFFETLVACLLLKRWSFFKTTYIRALQDCWRLRSYISEQRRSVAEFRKRSDFWMLRFFRLPLNRWFEIKRLFRFGLPRVDSK